MMSADEIKSNKGVNILLVTHGTLGEAFINSAKMIVGSTDSIKAISLLPTHGSEEFIKMLGEEINKYSDNILILTDIFGGTPSNISAMLSRDKDVVIISGVNLAMVIEAMLNRMEYNNIELGELVKKSAEESIQDIMKILSENT